VFFFAVFRRGAISTDSFSETRAWKVLSDAVRHCRLVFFTGLPASGKSFLLREAVLIAKDAGRRVKMIRWDIALAPFQEERILAKYPDVVDGSHPIVRRAAGQWGRQTIARWLMENTDPTEIIIGEVPIVGNRYSEFVQTLPDQAEPALSSDSSAFFYPVPTPEVREKLKTIRRTTFAKPQHPHEAKDAPPATMDLAWRLTHEKALQLGLVVPDDVDAHGNYSEVVYKRFFDHLLQHRKSHALEVGAIYSRNGSAHDLESGVTELIATPTDAANAISDVEAIMSADDAALAVQEWYKV
jgi:hypothetical protein